MTRQELTSFAEKIATPTKVLCYAPKTVAKLLTLYKSTDTGEFVLMDADGKYYPEVLFDNICEVPNNNNTFLKNDTDKLRYSLVPPIAIEALATILTFGAKKYEPNNWKKCEDTSRYTDALYRHLELWRNGEKTDNESGFSHLWHALTNIAFLIWFENKK